MCVCVYKYAHKYVATHSHKCKWAAWERASNAVEKQTTLIELFTRFLFYVCHEFEFLNTLNARQAV